MASPHIVRPANLSARLESHCAPLFRTSADPLILSRGEQTALTDRRDDAGTGHRRNPWDPRSGNPGGISRQEPHILRRRNLRSSDRRPTPARPYLRRPALVSGGDNRGRCRDHIDHDRSQRGLDLSGLPVDRQVRPPQAAIGGYAGMMIFALVAALGLTLLPGRRGSAAMPVSSDDAAKLAVHDTRPE